MDTLISMRPMTEGEWKKNEIRFRFFRVIIKNNEWIYGPKMFLSSHFWKSSFTDSHSRVLSAKRANEVSNVEKYNVPALLFIALQLRKAMHSSIILRDPCVHYRKCILLAHMPNTTVNKIFYENNACREHKWSRIAHRTPQNM